MDEPAKDTESAATSRGDEAKTLALIGCGLVAVWIVALFVLLSSTPGHVAGAPSIDMGGVYVLIFLVLYSPVALLGLVMAISNGKIYFAGPTTPAQKPEKLADSSNKGEW